MRYLCVLFHRRLCPVVARALREIVVMYGYLAMSLPRMHGNIVLMSRHTNENQISKRAIRLFHGNKTLPGSARIIKRMTLVFGDLVHVRQVKYSTINCTWYVFYFLSILIKAPRDNIFEIGCKLSP